MRKAILLSVLLLDFLFSAAQSYTVQLFNELNGLPTSFVFYVFKDSRGFLWIGSTNGLSRFDGRSMINYSLNDGLPNVRVDMIREDPQGGIWINTRDGLCYFDGKKFDTFHVVPQGTTSYLVDILKGRDGELEIMVNDYRFELKNGRPRRLPDRYVNKELVIGYYPLRNGDELCYTSKRRTYYRSADSIREITSFRNQSTGFLEVKGIVYAFNELGLFNMFPGPMQHLVVLENNTSTILKAAVDTAGVAWLNVENQGILMHDLNTGHEQWFNKDNSPLGDFSSMLFSDDHGVWIANKSGVGFIKRSAVISVPEIRSINGESVFKTFGTPGYLVTISENYALVRSIRSGASYEWKISIKSNDDNPVTDIAEDADGKLWIYYYQGDLLRQDPETGKVLFQTKLHMAGHVKLAWSSFYKALFVPQVFGLIKVSSGNRIDSIPSPGGLYAYKVCTNANGSSIWMQDYVKRLWRFSDGRLTDMATVMKPPDAPVCGVEATDTDLWLGTQGRGLYRYRLEAGKPPKLVKIYTTRDGLSTDFIINLLADSRGNLWVVTTNGINQIETKDGRELVRQRARLSGTVAQFSTGYIYEDALGAIRCVTEDGLITINPERLNPRPMPQNMYLLSVSSPNGPVSAPDDSTSGFFHLPINPSLPSTVGDLSFTFTAADLYASDINYRYMLEGADRSWITTNRGVANYYNLPSGNYVFRVKAVDENGTETRPAVFTFRIRPPFWKTWWFRSGIIMLVVGLIFYVIKRRESVLRRQNEMAVRFGELRMQALRAQMNPHFIFNTLNSIQSFVLENQTEAAARYLTKFARLIRLVLDKSSEDVTSLEDEIALLTYYVDLERMRFNNRFDYRFDIDPAIDRSVRIPTFLLQPHIENAILHGLQPLTRRGELILAFRLYGNDSIECTIRDNGIGRDAAKLRKEGHLRRHQSRGLAIINQRISILQEQKNKEVSLTVEDLRSVNGDAAGTLVRIIVPIL